MTLLLDHTNQRATPLEGHVTTEWTALGPKPMLLQLMGCDGEVAEVEGFPLALDDAAMLDLYTAMVVARRIDTQAVNLAQQGQLAVYASSRGQEASQVGAAFALADGDWMFPSYRELVAVVSRGVDVLEALALFRGTSHCGYDPHQHRVAPLCTPIATQALHAAGLAIAARLSGSDDAALTFVGDGGTSTGDFHEALNFAAVADAPCVFFVQNNQYAISVPFRRQTKAPTIAHRGIAYGMPGFRIDGNDALAVYAATTAALKRARDGLGPTLIEAVTYRMASHTTADDATRYRSDAEVEGWRHNDPLIRLEQFLRSRAVLDDRMAAEAHECAEDEARRMRNGMQIAKPIDPRGLFEHVYASIPAHLRAEREALERELQAASLDCAP